jgi:hypothetical protein
MSFVYNLSETEYLVFKQHNDGFELFSGHEGSPTWEKIATYKTGRWIWDGFNQHKLFWFLYNIYKKQFGKALKAYLRSLKERPATWELTCVRRRFNIKVTKLKRTWNEWFYDTFYGKI